MFKKKEYSKYVFFVLFIIVIIASYNLIRPLLASIVSAFLLSYIFYPLYKKIYEKTRWKNMSAGLIILLIIIIVFVPLSFSIYSLSKQAQSGFVVANSIFDRFSNLEYTQDGSLTSQIIFFSQKFNLDETFSDIYSKVANFIFDQASSVIIKIPVFLLHFFIILFIVFYMLKDGKKLLNYLFQVFILKDKHRKDIIKSIQDIIFAVVYGHFLTALVQGIVGAIGFYMFGFSSPVFWGLIMVFAGLIPFVGTAIVWVPAVIIKIIIDVSNQDNFGLLLSIIFILYGTLIISGIDNLIKPRIIGHRANIHPVVILLGVFGGLATFGIIGLILGPLLLSILITFIKIYNKEIIQNET